MKYEISKHERKKSWNNQSPHFESATLSKVCKHMKCEAIIKQFFSGIYNTENNFCRNRSLFGPIKCSLAVNQELLKTWNADS